MKKVDYVVCARKSVNGSFIPEPGQSRFLAVPPGALPAPSADQVMKKNDFIDAVMRKTKTDSGRIEYGVKDILVFIHGYNNEQDIVMKRHRKLKATLAKGGFKGEVISFDWPSNDLALNYLEDRHDARLTALLLVKDCILPFAALRKRGCTVNLHLLAHSTGAFVIREAFDDADDISSIASVNWSVSQVLFIGADVSSKCMSLTDSKTSSLYRHCVRLTNYSNRFDAVLKLSNIKRVGVSPRVGRVGLPDDHPPCAVDVDCSDYFEAVIKDQPDGNFIGTKCHSWHIGDPMFTRDMLETISGDSDRSRVTTRQIGPQGLMLKPSI